MLISEARVETDRPGRYLVQLCRHARHMGRSQSTRLRKYLDRDAPADGETPNVDAEWTEARGVVRIGRGMCTIRTAPNALLLRAEAPDEHTLRRIQQAITRNLSRFSRRDQLTVEWHPARANHLVAGEPDSAREQPPERARVARRLRGSVIVLVAVVALVIAVHLGLGGSALMAAPAKWTTNIVLAVVALKVIFIAAHIVPGVVLGRIALRRRKAASASKQTANPPDEP